MNTPVARPAPWACRIAAVLVGWHVFLFGMFLLVIAVFAVAHSSDIGIEFGSTVFYVVLAVAALMSGVAGFLLARKTHRWFTRRKPATVYVLLALLTLAAVLSFPQPLEPFTYTIY